MKIGLLSDTHGYLDKEILDFFAECDEIWHAGDIGSEQILDDLEKFKPIKAVWGNIDGTKIRARTKEFLNFVCEGQKVLITHIGGYPGKYAPNIKNLLLDIKPDIFIAGHSHILKVIYDNNLKLLHLNPGAAGNTGWHKFITAIRFEIENNTVNPNEVIKNIDIFEKKRS
ncbi:MAG: metallophosphoesterase family protein [Bacteroidota bacterium]|jgi:putative phosphoesterase|nr:metallophosphoesterase family protein [Bacteroidota bacterium]OQC46347.1 MAG: phosphodiesterase [Bacteroidetes bacterium ADurb.Bin028]HNY45098.1 metallophosphoesterase family protein [Bacteroidales bacterium]HOD88418.1 metallophosphoesterase family protein [Bacteroidales bacterium]HPX75705.1 metallophosphoesterase family protein [Bacteroidales bacterium]